MGEKSYKLTIILSEHNSHRPLRAIIHQGGGYKQSVPGGASRFPHASVILHNRDHDAAVVADGAVFAEHFLS